jgi:hypothetical protein
VRSFPLGDNKTSLPFAEVLNCQIQMFPLKYLETPISASRLHVVDRIKLEEKIEKKLDI